MIKQKLTKYCHWPFAKKASGHLFLVKAPEFIILARNEFADTVAMKAPGKTGLELGMKESYKEELAIHFGLDSYAGMVTSWVYNVTFGAGHDPVVPQSFEQIGPRFPFFLQRDFLAVTIDAECNFRLLCFL